VPLVELGVGGKIRALWKEYNLLLAQAVVLKEQ
jgi:hypothetical protein